MGISWFLVGYRRHRLIRHPGLPNYRPPHLRPSVSALPRLPRRRHISSLGKLITHFPTFAPSVAYTRRLLRLSAISFGGLLKGWVLAQACRLWSGYLACPRQSRKQFEVAARQDGFAEFQFRERNSEGQMVSVTERAEYFPVYFLEPHTGNESAFGFDLGSSSTRLKALYQARDSGGMVATARIKLVQEREDQFGFLVFSPIYSQPATTLDERRTQLDGFALGVFRIADLVRLAIDEDLFQVAVFDQSSTSEEQQQLYPASGEVDLGDFQQTISLHVADRVWTVGLTLVASFHAGTPPWLAIAIWIGVLTGLWTSRELISTRRDNSELAVLNDQLKTLTQEAKLANRELERSNQELDSFAHIAATT